MVTPKSLILAILCLSIALAGAGLWIMLRPAPARPTLGTQGSDRQMRNHDFFGTGKHYDMENGQEMKPRW